jgi:hypothetical protein
VAADEELVDGRDPLIEALERHFEILGAGGADDHPGEIRGMQSGKHAGGRREKKFTSR